MVKNKGDKMKMNIDTLMQEEINKNIEEKRIELICVDSKNTLMSINGERLKDITINNVSYNVSRDTNYAIFNIIVPLDKYKLVIDQRNKITPQF